MASLVPSREQIQTMLGQAPDRPMVMVNLLKFRDQAAYAPDQPEAKAGLSGRAAYARYGAVALEQVQKRGGRVAWGGATRFVMIGEAGEHDWDEVVCVYYPSPAAFLEMTADADYLAAHHHREAALERTALICCDAGMGA